MSQDMMDVSFFLFSLTITFESPLSTSFSLGVVAVPPASGTLTYPPLSADESTDTNESLHEITGGRGETLEEEEELKRKRKAVDILFFNGDPDRENVAPRMTPLDLCLSLLSLSVCLSVCLRLFFIVCLTLSYIYGMVITINVSLSHTHTHTYTHTHSGGPG